MQTRKHQWATFNKKRIRVKACANCGEMHLPSNSNNYCEPKTLAESQIVKAGYQIDSAHH